MSSGRTPQTQYPGAIGSRLGILPDTTVIEAREGNEGGQRAKSGQVLPRAESKATGGQWGGEGGGAVPEPLGSEPGPQTPWSQSKRKHVRVRLCVHVAYVWGRDAS